MNLSSSYYRNDQVDNAIAQIQIALRLLEETNEEILKEGYNIEGSDHNPFAEILIIKLSSNVLKKDTVFKNTKLNVKNFLKKFQFLDGIKYTISIGFRHLGIFLHSQGQ